MKTDEQRLDHRGLSPITDAGPGARVHPDRKIGPEDVSQRDQHCEARFALAALDLRKEALVDLRGGSDGSLGEVGVEAQLANLVSQSQPNLARRSPDNGPRTGPATACRSRRIHGAIELIGYRLAIIRRSPPG